MSISFVRSFVLAAVALMCASLAPHSNGSAATLKTLYSFCPRTGCSDGAQPVAGLIKDKAGNLYGTTLYGGNTNCGQGAGCGTVFKLRPPRAGETKWTATVLHQFCSRARCADGDAPEAGLIMDASGNLFGTTSQGGAMGSGTVFELTPNADRTVWTETVLHSFCSKAHCVDGARPQAGLIMDKAGDLYGTTRNGGASASLGTAFELTPNAGGTRWTETILYKFCSKTNCTDGSQPMAGLATNRTGTLYGTTIQGGANNQGTVFALTPGPSNAPWAETILHSFCSKTNCVDGESPVAGLILDSMGNLYGTTPEGGRHGQGAGMAFEMMPNGARTLWAERIVHSFGSKRNDGYHPEASLIMDSSGRLYGTTVRDVLNDSGAVFELTPNADGTRWTERTLHKFCSRPSCADGDLPLAGLILDASGNLYGTTSLGGGAANAGTVFEVTP